nr:MULTISPECIES: transposase [Aureimonas]
MLKKPAPERTAPEIVTLDMLVPKDHLLRKIDQVIDFLLYPGPRCRSVLREHGRPALDPTWMFKALMVGYLFDVRSERQLIREIEVNVAYRWFLRLKLPMPSDRTGTDSHAFEVPSEHPASAFSQPQPGT